jgi:hypothetical protein
MHRIAVLLVLVAACKKSESTAPATGSGSAATGSAKPADSPKYDMTKPAPKIECAKVIPQAVVDKHFKDATPKHDDPIVGGPGEPSMTTCRFVLDEKANRKVLINYNCGPDFANLDEYLGLLEKQIAAKFERVPGVGRGGYRIGTSTVGAQHRSLPCIVFVDLSFLEDGTPERAKDYMPLVTELEAALTDPPP